GSVRANPVLRKNKIAWVVESTKSSKRPFGKFASSSITIWDQSRIGAYTMSCANVACAARARANLSPFTLTRCKPQGFWPKRYSKSIADITHGQHGSAEFSVEKLLNERPEYFVLNGSVGALTKLHPLQAKVGETVRIFFGVGGPNYTSSFHVIGEIFD